MHTQGFRLRIRMALLSATGVPGSMANFVVARYSFEDGVESNDLTNSDGARGGLPAQGAALPGPPCGAVTPGTPRASIELEQATLITNARANPFLVPFSLRSGVYVRLEIFPDRSFPHRHLFTACLVTNCSQAGEVSALQPVTLRMQSDGPYSLYSAQ